MDERTLREIYLPAFEAAVREADVGAVMDSYNLLNGEHTTQNYHLNSEILKKEWAFKGILMSDWWATYDGVAAANGGLDLEMPDPNFLNAQTLLPAVRDGRVSELVMTIRCAGCSEQRFASAFLITTSRIIHFRLQPGEPQGCFGRGARKHRTAEERTFPIAAGPEQIEDHCGARSRCVAGGHWGGGSSQVTPYAAPSLMTGLSDYYIGRRRYFTLAASLRWMRCYRRPNSVCRPASLLPAFLRRRATA